MERESINSFLVEIFNQLLKLEERALSDFEDGLSVKEFHVIQTVKKCHEIGHNTMGELAAAHDVTVGTMTIAVKTLEKKQFLRRDRKDRDKRLVRIALTEKGERASAYHERFHRELIQALTASLDRHQLEAMEQALEIITRFFWESAQQSKGKE